MNVPGWRTDPGSTFTAIEYGDGYSYPDDQSPGPANRGTNLFGGGLGNGTADSGATQSIQLTNYIKEISTGKATFSLSGWLGGYAGQDDYASCWVTWITSAGAALMKFTIGPVTAADRGSTTGLVFRSVHGLIPSGTTLAKVTLTMMREEGTSIDGYADNLSLTIG